MSAVLSHPNIATNWILGILRGDATLNAMQVNSRALVGVYYMIAPQEVTNPYPCIIVNQPILRALSQHLHCNGRFISQGTFYQDVRAVARDVEPDDAELLAIRARVQELLEGQNGTVTGGLVGSCIVWDFPPDQRLDRGNYTYSEILTTFRLTAQLD